MTDSNTTELLISKLLKKRGLSQAKLARMSNVNESSMSRIVRGIEPPYPKRGQRIAETLGWEGDWRDLFTPEQAVAATLVSGTCKNVAREWEKTSFAHAGTSFCCSECGAHYVDVECYYAGLADKDGEQIRTNFCPSCGKRVSE